MNRIILIGNIGNDPEIVNIESGNKIAKFSLATSDNYKDKNGQKVEQTDWHSITVFGKLADIVEQYFKKGNKVMVEGKSKTRSYETQNGEKRYVTEIVMSEFEFLTPKS